jgi:MFS family permease
MANRVLLDLDVLKDSRDFRLLFSGQLVSLFGSQLTAVAVAFQVYALTRSSLQVGAVSFAQLFPHILGTLLGGALGDRVDRRRILMVASAISALTSAVLAFNAASAYSSIVVIYVVTAAAAGLAGTVSTASTSLIPSLVRAERLTPAIALMQVIDQLCMVAGPTVAGLMIASTGLGSTYVADALTFLGCALMVSRIPAVPSPPGAEQPLLESIIDGLRYLRGRQVLQGVYLVDLNATVFGLPRALFPALARSVFGGGAATLGFLYTAPAAGALAGAVSSGWLRRIRRQAVAVILAVCAWGAVIAVFGFTHVLWPALLLLAIAGWADVTSAVLRGTILQTSVSDAFRSRISGIQMAVVEGGPRLGDLESGAVAAAVSTRFSVVSGGIVCIAGAIALSLMLPGFRRYCRPYQTEAEEK